MEMQTKGIDNARQRQCLRHEGSKERHCLRDEMQSKRKRKAVPCLQSAGLPQEVRLSLCNSDCAALVCAPQLLEAAQTLRAEILRVVAIWPSMLQMINKPGWRQQAAIGMRATVASPPSQHRQAAIGMTQRCWD